MCLHLVARDYKVEVRFMALISLVPRLSVQLFSLRAKRSWTESLGTRLGTYHMQLSCESYVTDHVEFTVM